MGTTADCVFRRKPAIFRAFSESVADLRRNTQQVPYRNQLQRYLNKIPNDRAERMGPSRAKP